MLLYTYICIHIYVYIERERLIFREVSCNVNCIYVSIYVSIYLTCLPTCLSIHTPKYKSDFSKDRSSHKEHQQPTAGPECAFVSLCTEPHVSPAHTTTLEVLEVAWLLLTKAS